MIKHQICCIWCVWCSFAWFQRFVLVSCNLGPSKISSFSGCCSWFFFYSRSTWIQCFYTWSSTLILADYLLMVVVALFACYSVLLPWVAPESFGWQDLVFVLVWLSFYEGKMDVYDCVTSLSESCLDPEAILLIGLRSLWFSVFRWYCWAGVSGSNKSWCLWVLKVEVIM